MAVYDTGPIPNVDGSGNRIGRRLYVRIENIDPDYSNDALLEVYRLTGPNPSGYSQQIVYARNLVNLSAFGSPVTANSGPAYTGSVTLNNALISAFGVRIFTSESVEGQVKATIYTEGSNGALIELQKVLPGDFGVPLINPYIQAVNRATTVPEMRAAIEDPGLGLNLTDYNTLSEPQKDQVAQILINSRPLFGYLSVASIQTALNNAVNQVTVDPNNIYVRAGAVGGDGSAANPFGTIPQGIAAVNPNGTVHIRNGTYSITSQIVVNKQGITLLGQNGTNLVVSMPGPVFVPILITAQNVTINGLTMTSDQPYQAEFIQIGANNVVITNNTIYGPPQPLPMDTWVVNRAIVSQGALTGMQITINTFHSLRTGMYINPNGVGAINNNVVYNTKGGFLVDRAFTTFTGNSWGVPPNEFDIVLLAGTTTGYPYDNLAQLSAQNSNATISDQR